MAQGDAKAGMSSIASNAYLVVQPAAEEEWVIKRLFNRVAVGTSPDKVADMGFLFYDGTNSSGFGEYAAPETSLLLYQPPLQLYVNNTTYFRLKNNGSTNYIGYCGIQIK